MPYSRAVPCAASVKLVSTSIRVVPAGTANSRSSHLYLSAAVIVPWRTTSDGAGDWRSNDARITRSICEIVLTTRSKVSLIGLTSFLYSLSQRGTEMNSQTRDVNAAPGSQLYGLGVLLAWRRVQ